MKIAQKLTLGFTGIALLIGIVGYVSVNASQKALQKSIGEGSAMLVQDAVDKIDRAIYYRIERWKSYSMTDRRLKESLLSSNREFDKLDNIQEYIDRKDREWISMPKEKLTPFMQEIINNKLSQQLKERMDFYEKRCGYRVFGEIFITNKYGANIAQTGRTSDYYQADEEWWQAAKKDEFYMRDVEYDESADVLREGSISKATVGSVLGYLEKLGIESKKKRLGGTERRSVSLDIESGKIFYSEGDNAPREL